MTPVIRGRTARGSPLGLIFGFLSVIILVRTSAGQTVKKYGYFNRANNSEVTLVGTNWKLRESGQQTELSFRSCSSGELLSQNATNGDYLKLILSNTTLEVRWDIGDIEDSLFIRNQLNSNDWFRVSSQYYLGSLFLNISKAGRTIYSEIIANSTFRTYILNLDFTNSDGLVVGRGFTGCIMEGANVQFVNNPGIRYAGVSWSDVPCPQSSEDCPSGNGDVNPCLNSPCEKGGTCVEDADTSLGYRCDCPRLYNGTNCENDLSVFGCVVDPCLYGTCTPEPSPPPGSRPYSCNCTDGYTGINCDREINECSSSPCKNNGQCVDKVNGFECNCTQGFKGVQCEDDIDECENNVCGTRPCFNNIGSFTCNCPIGSEQVGTECQEIDECRSNPCDNGATCTDLVASYNCTCVTGYTGDRCQEDINNCIPDPCTGANSQCVDLVNAYRCECKAGYSGVPPNCEDIDECDAQPCKNGGTCHNEENRYTCDCAEGFNGTNCELDIDDCASNPCLNSGSCEDGVNDFSCTCVQGFKDKDCGTNIDDCKHHECRHQSICWDQVNDYKCNCTPGYTGRLCEIDINECESNPCRNGTCHESVNSFTCNCWPGYTGTTCENDINECQPDPCKNGGTCVNKLAKFECNCADSWMGEICDQVYDACSPVFENCKNGANCSSSPPQHEFSCDCQPGYSGRQCEENIDDCVGVSCPSPFLCLDGISDYTCGCPVGFEGDDCTHNINECNPNPCLHGGTCTDGNGTHTCHCQLRTDVVNHPGIGPVSYEVGYLGDNCEIDIDECSKYPPICLNGGDCYNDNEPYECKCGRSQNGYYHLGRNCELTTSYCESADDVKDDLPACKNNGTCISENGNYTCFCAPGFTGRRCEIDINECASTPCLNNGTCDDRVNGYVCTCIPGITGTNCEVDINECASDPCNNGGQCIDQINGYICNCTDTGFKGPECQENIDDCLLYEPQPPCFNDGNCSDLIKDFSCSCYHGYEGKQCGVDINECEIQGNPCGYNSKCYQKSDRNYYKNPDVLVGNGIFFNRSFSYEDAAGVVCICIPGITGLTCDINIDDCDHPNCLNGATCNDLINGYNCTCALGYDGYYCGREINECQEPSDPCQNGGSCTDLVADYRCTCPEKHQGKYYAGKNCTFELTSCEHQYCLHESICKPFLINEEAGTQDYTCECTHGYTGRHCEIPTTVSFNKSSYIMTNQPTSPSVTETSTISFQFRTTLRDAILMAWISDHSTGLFMNVALKDSTLHIGYHDPAVSSPDSLNVHVIDKPFNDADWHGVHVTRNVTSDQLKIILDSPKCPQQNCDIILSYDNSVTPRTNVLFGSLGSSFSTAKTLTNASFVGCIEDIRVGSLTLEPGSYPDIFHGIVSGCPRSDPCRGDPCNGNGFCVDLWNTFLCECRRPYLGATCLDEYTAATFSYGNTESWAMFSFTDEQKQALQSQLDLSFFFRSRQPDGIIMFMGDRPSVNPTFIVVELFRGNLICRIADCTYGQFLYEDGLTFDTGDQNLVTLNLKRAANSAELLFYVNNTLLNNITWVTTGCSFNVGSMYFGGKIPDVINGRRKRDTVVSQLPGSDVNDFSSTVSYKGTVQDPQLNGFSLQFYPSASPLQTINVSSASQLQKGEVTDPICNLTSPCENNSTCSDVFFNDYRCECMLGYRGKNCSDLDFCTVGQCPPGTTCQSLNDGFECVSTVTFDGQRSYATYLHNLASQTQIDSLSTKLRTVAWNGHFFTIGLGNYFYELGIVGKRIQISYSVQNGVVDSLSSSVDVDDARWYDVVVTETSDSIELSVSSEDGAVSDLMYKNITSRSVTLTSLVMNSNIILIGYQNKPVTNDHNFKGCLKEVRIQNILLPFVRDDLIINNTRTTNKFLLQSQNNLQNDCTGGTGCQDNQCSNSATCRRDYYGYICECKEGFTGEYCEVNSDDCKVDSCANGGRCIDVVNGYWCQCASGYYGSRCENSVSTCATSDPCISQLNQGLCEDTADGGFNCSCTALPSGGQCDGLLRTTCESNSTICQNEGVCNTVNITTKTETFESFNCTCVSGYTDRVCSTAVSPCADDTCKNGGNCSLVPLPTGSGSTFSCDCPTGYTGETCDEDINDCANDPCKNGGVCDDHVNSYTCNCTEGWQGSKCTDDVNECDRNPCQHNGQCINSLGNFSCNCDNTGYTGAYCENDVDECLLPEVPCKYYTNCTNNEGSYECECKYGYQGHDCDMGNCSLVTCENQATCEVSQTTGQWRCNCLEFYEGERCEIRGPCADGPCVAGNTRQCVQNITENSYDCLCKTGWEGTNCSQDINECELATPPCQNGANCTDSPPGSYTCDCTLGYEGKNCTDIVDNCAPNPCNNSGTCENLIGAFNCTCSAGYKGETCMEDINECETSNPCENGGTCTNSVGSFSCQCDPKYMGTTCESLNPDYSKEEEDNIWIIVGPVVAAVLILIIIGVVIFLVSARKQRATRGVYSPSRQEISGSRVELGNVMKKPNPERLI